MTARTPFSRIRIFGLTLVATAALVTACGGGGDDASSSSTSFAVGRISGFGSIIVNGVHYDDSRARVVDEDGQSRGRDDLKLGMVVEVSASDFSSSGTPSATAQSIEMSSLLRGPVDSVGVSPDTLGVLGQTVKVTATTVFDDSLAGGLAGIEAGDVVKIYGTFDPTTGVYTATRIESAAGTSTYRIRGVVGSVGTGTITIGTAVIDVSRLALPAGGLKAGDRVRLRLQTTPNTAGAWVATELRSGALKLEDKDHAEVEGTISEFTSPTSFSVDGLPVDATNAVFEDGTNGLELGARVEVEGMVVNGVLVARKVELESEDDDRDEGFEIDGSITAANAEAKTFVVRGVTVRYSASVEFRDGNAANLVVGARVEVKGMLSSDGTTVDATRIEIKR
jgi:hypothetical protein